MWRVREQRPDLAQRIAGMASVSGPVARMLSARGFSATDALGRFLRPRLADTLDPLELAGVERAVERLVGALRRGERIAVHGDYDADGLCATTILGRTLRWLGADPVLFVPHRLNDGYGLSLAAVEQSAALGVRLLVTVDTGICALREVMRARELGMDVIVTDHHLPGASLPDAVAIVNPNLPGVPYAGSSLCGAGVAFKVAHALVRAERAGAPEGRAFVRSLLDLVALATVADVVPLVGENRAYVRHGLESLMHSGFAGVRALMKYSMRGASVTSETIGFGLAPRLNAASRTDGDAAVALNLLMTDDDSEAALLAERLDRLNKARRGIEADILAGCLSQIEARRAESAGAFVLASEGWHFGVVGTVASRLSERFHRPAVVLGIEGAVAKGSARSIPGYDVHDGLTCCREHLQSYGGHRAAAGLRLELARLEGFREALDAHARGAIRGELARPCVEIDTVVSAEEITWQLVGDMAAMEPYGEGNSPPVFMASGATAGQAPRIVGNGHLKLSLRIGGRSFSAIGFSLGSQIESWRGGGPHDLLFRPMENVYLGERSLELEILDTRASA